MRIVLRSDVDNVGTKGEVLDVANGFARNFLLPRGLAMKATKGSETQAGSMRRGRAVRDAAARSAAEEVAKTLVPATISVAARAGTEGRLFGSVTSHEIADAIGAQTGIEIDRRTLVIDEPIKTTGAHQVTARLHPDVQFPVSIEVVGG